MGSPSHKTVNAFRSATVGCCMLLCFVLSGTAAGQADALFETASIERRLTKQFKLTRNEIKLLHPMIERENADLILIYGQYSEMGSADYMSLWNAVRAKRENFETDRLSGLLPRQKQVLRTARLEFESRIADQWLDDYLQTLTDFLELEMVQVSFIERVFENEQKERLKILAREAGQTVRLADLWQKLSDDREKQMERILSDSQLREYRSLTAPVRLIAQNRRIRVNC
jgi:hypothetical protein